jgi:Uma2 family endonuclease
MGAAPILKTTVDEYLDYDDAADCRTEFHGGEIFRMDDVSVRHGIIELALGTALNGRLKESPCKSMAGVRFRTAGDDYVRPDIAVICGPPQYTPNGRAATNPKLIVEILSPSTADFDYGGKFELYREMESLQEYALVSQTRHRVEVFRKTAEKEWLLSTYKGLDETIPFHSVSVTVPMTEIYAGVEF